MKEKIINFIMQLLGLIVFTICLEKFEKIAIERHKINQAYDKMES